MDINGVWASLSFPSMITGFCGRVYSQCSDPELGLATTRAFNDWVHDEWWQPHPDRIIPLGITWLSDPELGAAEIRRNAERGFRAVTLPERPHQIGYPSIFDEHWAPILEACADTGTVVCLHVGSSGMGEIPPGCDRAIMPLVATVFSQLSLQACTEWLWAGWTVRFPDLKVAMAEGGIGWVAMLIDRLDNIVDRSGYGMGWDERPADVLRRSFWFCTIDDPSTIDTRHAIGIDHIMVEVDYPHGDSTWPDTQAVIEQAWGHLPAGRAPQALQRERRGAVPPPAPGRRAPGGLTAQRARSATNTCSSPGRSGASRTSTSRKPAAVERGLDLRSLTEAQRGVRHDRCTGALEAVRPAERHEGEVHLGQLHPALDAPDAGDVDRSARLVTAFQDRQPRGAGPGPRTRGGRRVGAPPACRAAWRPTPRP